MSGGSFDYLYGKDTHDLAYQTGPLTEMAAWLDDHGFHDAGGETRDIALDIPGFCRRTDARVARLSKLWKAVEWETSCDTSREETLEAVAAYRKESQ